MGQGDTKWGIMKVWITTWALTEGIIETDAEVCKSSPSMIVWNNKGYDQYAHGDGKNWHRDRHSAINKAGLMKDAKLSSLERAIERIKKLEFK